MYCALPNPDDHKVSCKSALYAFALCCRRFHGIGQKLLYRSIAIYSTRPILLLARTILGRPDLAENVQHLDIYADADDDRIHLDVRDIEESFDIVLHRLWRSVQTMSGHLDNHRSNSGSAAVALLLLLLPDLRWLDIQFSSDLTHVTSLMRASATKQLAGLAPLRHRQSWDDFRLLPKLSVLWLTPEYNTDIDLSSIIKLPALRSLSLMFSEPLRTHWTIENRCSAIQSLELSDCGLAEDEIFNILGACGELRRFTYHWNQPWSDNNVWDDEWDDGIDVASWIIEGLKPSSDKLEVLQVTGSTSLRHDATPMGNLVAFSRLQSLCVPAVMILNSNARSPSQDTLQFLPRTLKHLRLVDAETIGDATIESKLLKCLCAHENFVALASLTLDWQLNAGQSDRPRFRRLEEFCRHRGIDFTLNLYSCLGYKLNGLT